MVDVCKDVYTQNVSRLALPSWDSFDRGPSPAPMSTSLRFSSKERGFTVHSANIIHSSSRSRSTWKSGAWMVAPGNFKTKLVNATAVSDMVVADVEPTAKDLVSQLLELVAQSDRGADIEDSRRGAVLNCVEALESLGMDEPLKSNLIFGEWEVSYTSSPTAAGGYYRSLLGRALLKTTELVQTIREPDIVGNRVSFQLVGLVPGKVSLEGRLKALDNKWVEVTFVAPHFELGALNFAYGGESSVKLQTTYLDETIRIGRGGRGSVFVFKRL